MIIRHSPEQVQAYYDTIGINQSGLKTLLNDGVEKFLSEKDTLQRQNDLYYEEKKHFIIGSAADCILTHGEEIFKQKYYSSGLRKKPGDKSMSVIQLAFAKAKEKYPTGPDANLSLYPLEVFEACNEQAFYMNRAKPTHEEDTRIATLIKDNGNAYWLDLIMSEGKQILSEDEKRIIDSIIISVTTHKFTAHLLRDSKDIDIVFQFPMFWNFDDVDCKGLVDIVIINHTSKKIFPIDFKTLGDYVTRFNKAAKKRRYDIQGSFYSYGLNKTKATLLELCGRNVKAEDYTIANFAFIAESTIKPGCPLVFPLTDELLAVGRNGDNIDMLGWETAIGLYKSWQSIDFSLEKRVEENNGVLFIDEYYDYPINL